MTVVELIDILLEDKPSTKLREKKEELIELIPEIKECDGFDQHSEWHQYDVLEHILHVIDNVEKNKVLRIAALFHDIKKPEVFYLDERGGHFPEHWTKSALAFKEFAIKYKLDNELVDKVYNLILFHDLDIDHHEDKINDIVGLFTKEEIDMLFDFKKADLLAQNEKFKYRLEDYKRQKERILKEYERSTKDEYYI